MKKILTLIITIILCINMFIISFGANTILTFSDNNIKLGDTVTVTAKFSGNDISGVQCTISYDTTVLTYKSCSGTGTTSYNSGSVVSYLDSGSENSYSVSVVFTANKVDSTMISVKDVRVSDSNGNAISGFEGAAAKLAVVKTEEKTTEKVTEKVTEKITRKVTETTTEPQTTKSSRNIVVFDGKEYEIARDSAFVEAPEGFDETYSDFKGSRILTYTSKDKTQQIISLMDSSGKNLFVLFDDDEDTFSETIWAKSGDHDFIILTAPKDIIPKGFTAIPLIINGKEIEGYQNTDFVSNDLYLVYGINSDGIAKFYTYDEPMGTFQRYLGGVQIPEQLSKEPTVSTTVQMTQAVKTENEINLNNRAMIKLTCAMGVFMLAAITLAITFGRKLFCRRDKKEEEIIEYTY